jgi:ribosome recycling factor
MKTGIFDEALEIIESFPEEQKESIIEIVKRRLTEERRERLAQIVKEAREEYARGEVRRGTVNDLMLEITQRVVINVSLFTLYLLLTRRRL